MTLILLKISAKSFYNAKFCRLKLVSCKFCVQKQSDMNFLWQHPFNCIVSAPTKSGKTEFVKKLAIFARDLIEPEPKKIIWCYTEWQNTYEDLLSKINTVVFVEGLPNFEELKNDKNTPKLLIIDDMMCEISKDVRLTDLFTKYSHHWNISIINIVQNAFYSGIRTSRINSQYLVLMKNPSDKLQIQTLAKQLFPGSKHFIEAFEDATSKPYGYLLIDLTQLSPDNMRLRTCIFPDDQYNYVYVPK